MQILMTRMVQALRKQMLKVAFFGNKASVDDAVNITDGMWSVYIPQLVAGKRRGFGQAILTLVFESNR